MSRKNKSFNGNAITFTLSILLMIGGLFMLPGILFSLYYGTNDVFALLASAATTCFTGLILWLSTKNGNLKVGKREAYLIVGSSYFVMSLFGCLPYLFSESIPNFTNAYFETVSGFTTTGASVLNNIEAVPPGILFWRSMTQWMGGMGIILLTLMILPHFGIGGTELFVAEVPGPTKEKIHPRIKETAKRLWLIYLGMTLTLAGLLYLEGMSVFDAINHALTTLSTGGFSTKNTSIAAFNSPLIEYTIILFMFLAGMNFTLHYILLMKGEYKSIIKHEEWRLYTGFIVITTVLLTVSVMLIRPDKVDSIFREMLFSIVSIVTTTGYATVDYTQYIDFTTMIFFWLLFTGGMAGSTSGGIKAIRHLLMVKNGVFEIRRKLHPRAIIPVRFNGKVVPENVIYDVLAFFVIYVLIFIMGSVLLAVLDPSNLDILTAMSATATSIGNVGPGIGEVGPANNFSVIGAPGKWLLSTLMVMGRLEIFTILILFTPYFWREL